MTPWVAESSFDLEIDWSSGVTAMHSITSACAPNSAAVATMRFCSMMLGPAGRNTGSSRPSGRIMRASVPVVLAQVTTPCARRPAAISRVTLDLPRVPFT